MLTSVPSRLARDPVLFSRKKLVASSLLSLLFNGQAKPMVNHWSEKSSLFFGKPLSRKGLIVGKLAKFNCSKDIELFMTSHGVGLSDPFTAAEAL